MFSMFVSMWPTFCPFRTKSLSSYPGLNGFSMMLSVLVLFSHECLYIPDSDDISEVMAACFGWISASPPFSIAFVTLL